MAMEEFAPHEESAFEDTITPFQSDKTNRARQGHWKRAWPYCVKRSEQTVCAITDKTVEQAKKDGKMYGQKSARGGERQRSVDIAKARRKEKKGGR